MVKKYKVNWLPCEVVENSIPYITFGAELEAFVTASSKAEAVMQVVEESRVYKILNVERVKGCRD